MANLAKVAVAVIIGFEDNTDPTEVPFYLFEVLRFFSVFVSKLLFNVSTIYFVH